MTTLQEQLESATCTSDRIMYGLGALVAAATDIYTISRIMATSNDVMEGAGRTLWQAIPIASVACLGAVCFKNAFPKNTSIQ